MRRGGGAASRLSLASPAGNGTRANCAGPTWGPVCLRLVALAGLISVAPAAYAQDAGQLAMCAGCHNPDGNSALPENPKLAGFHATYIVKQLSDFKSGRRANPVMGAIAGQIDEKDFAALAKHFSEQRRTSGSVSDPKLAAHGKTIYEEGIVGSAVPACAGCHNDDGSGTAKFPRLAGQHPRYLIQQMNNFKSGARNNDSREVMRAVARRMSEQEIRAVAEYIAGLGGE